MAGDMDAPGAGPSHGRTAAARDGVIAGLIGGLTTTLFMQALVPKLVPVDMQPTEDTSKRLVEWAEAKIGQPHALSEQAATSTALGAHLAYSAAAGALYALVRETARGTSTPLAGVLLGVAVWASGPEGWIPALGVLPPTHEQPPKKWPVPIAAHLAYGTATALAYAAIRREGSRRRR